MISDSSSPLGFGRFNKYSRIGLTLLQKSLSNIARILSAGVYIPKVPSTSRRIELISYLVSGRNEVLESCSRNSVLLLTVLKRKA